MPAWKGLRAVPPLEWMRTIRDGIDLSKSVKSVAFCLALHAHAETCEAYPGWKRLAWESGCSRRTVLSALRELEGCGLLYCVERGSTYGVRNKTSKYTLTLHDDIGMITMTYDAWLKMNDLMTPADFIQSQAPKESKDPWAALPATLWITLRQPGAAIAPGAVIAPGWPEPGAKSDRNQVQKATGTRCSHCTPRGHKNRPYEESSIFISPALASSRWVRSIFSASKETR